jgi:signal transduction histidine kinase
VISALERGGWVAAGIATASALLSERRHARRLECVARASHELRGPITAARLGLEAGDIPPPRLRALELELDRATLALADLSCAAGGRVTAPRLEEVDVNAVVGDCVEALRPAAVERAAELRLDWPGPAAVVLGDRLRIAQAVDNLLANAIEHGGGLIEVAGRVVDGAVRLEVTDGGPGLSAPVAELASRVRRGRGWRGRGLAIASSIARDHGGRVAAAPSDRGARVVLELPAA